MADFTIDAAYPSPSGNTEIDALLEHVPRWTYQLPSTGDTVTYNFMQSAIAIGNGDPVANFMPLNDTQKSAVRQILDTASSLTGLTFVETSQSSGADILFGTEDIPDSSALGIIYNNWTWTENDQGHVTSLDRYDFIYTDNKEYGSDNASPKAGNLGYDVLLVEIGHALGLDHPDGKLPASEDNTDNTVMSHHYGSGGIPSTYQKFDIAALSYIYGSGGSGNSSSSSPFVASGSSVSGSTFMLTATS